jgi:hypothetical protein
MLLVSVLKPRGRKPGARILEMYRKRYILFIAEVV